MFLVVLSWLSSRHVVNDGSTLNTRNKYPTLSEHLINVIDDMVNVDGGSISIEHSKQVPDAE